MLHRKYPFLLALSSAFALFPISSMAQGVNLKTLSETVLDAKNGEWVALHHFNSSGTDKCIATSNTSNTSTLSVNVTLEKNKPTIQIHLMNAHWHLNSGKTKENVILTADHSSQKLSMLALDQNTLAATIETKKAEELLATLEKNSETTLLFDSKTKETIPLEGSNEAFNSLRACSIEMGLSLGDVLKRN
ncbi:hypothetical protein FAI40_01140 [Acetobacteraceae bacterium]|nr:hypothetical protein FAI40_01140 [Acetobacteraceae bacterium]